MKPNSTTGATSDSGREQIRRWTALTTLLAGGLILAPAASWTIPAQALLAQEDPAAAANSGGQVIAQGISRLPKGDLAWTVRRLDVPGEKGTAIETFPLGFALADGATVALLDDGGDVLSILDDGEGAFLPNGKGGALASYRADTAGVFEVGLVAAEDVAGGKATGSIVGNPFTPPDGRSFEIELARATLNGGEQVGVPASRSGAPVLFLVTDGTLQLTPPGGQPVELAAGQYALLLGEVVAASAGDAPAAFVAAAIGDAVAQSAAADGTPQARAGRGDRQRDRDAGAGGGKPAKEKKAKVRGGGGQGGGGGQASGGGQGSQGGGRGGRGGGRGGQGGQGNQGGQTQQPQVPSTGATPVPGDGSSSAGTPTPVTLPQEPAPASPTVPDNGAPTSDATPPGAETAPEDESTVVQDDTQVEDEDATPESGTEAESGEETVTEEGGVDESAAPTTPAEGEQTLPVEEAPPADAPVEEQAGIESEAIAPPEAEQTLPVEEAPVVEAPIEEAPPPAEGEQPADAGSGG